MPEIAKPLSYVERLAKALRLVRAAQYRSDQKLAVRELCEAMGELTGALLEREPGQSGQQGAAEPAKPPPA